VRAFTKLARRYREGTGEMQAYDSFESALRDSDSYEDPRLVEIVKEKTRRYRDALASAARPAIETRQTVQNMFVLSYVEPQRPLNVLEVGGACGAGYFESKLMLPARIRHWAISETPAMAAAGQSLSNDPDLSFHNDIASAATRLDSRDLAIAQGVLQYTGDPLQVLASLFSLDFSYVYLTRTAVAEVDVPVFTKQETDLSAHGPGQLPNAPDGRSSQPLTLVSWDALAATIPSNYEVVFKFVESEERSLSIGGRTINVRDMGALFIGTAGGSPATLK
jgi:putative methyltransferase (TIGR04325 family)